MTDIEAIRIEMLTEAATAAREFANKYYGGKDGGACGFAWVSIYPTYKGNTKLGKSERSTLKQLGFEASYDSGFQFWDPSNWFGQSIDIKEAGAVAAAAVLKRHGFKAYAGSRLD